MKTNDAERKDAKEIIGELGWPNDIPVERLVASVYDRAKCAGMIESEVILGFTFDRAELPRQVTREDRLMIALNAWRTSRPTEDCWTGCGSTGRS